MAEVAGRGKANPLGEFGQAARSLRRSQQVPQLIEPTANREPPDPPERFEQTIERAARQMRGADDSFGIERAIGQALVDRQAHGLQTHGPGQRTGAAVPPFKPKVQDYGKFPAIAARGSCRVEVTPKQRAHRLGGHRAKDRAVEWLS